MKKFTMIMSNGVRNEKIAIVAENEAFAKMIVKSIKANGQKNDRMVKSFKKGE